MALCFSSLDEDWYEDDIGDKYGTTLVGESSLVMYVKDMLARGRSVIVDLPSGRHSNLVEMFNRNGIECNDETIDEAIANVFNDQFGCDDRTLDQEHIVKIKIRGEVHNVIFQHDPMVYIQNQFASMPRCMAACIKQVDREVFEIWK